MAPGEHYRLALTAFAEPAGLWRTVSMLLDAGVPAEQLCIVGLASSIARFAPSSRVTDGKLDQLIALHHKARDWSGSGGQERILTTSEPLLGMAFQAEAADGRGVDRQLASPSTSDIESDIRGALVTLIVRSSDAQQQALATRSLLANAQHQVMTYEQVGAGPSDPPHRR